MAITWYLADLKTGQVITELPLQANGALERTISTATTVPADLLIHDTRCPANWAYLLDPRTALIVPVDDGVPLGVGYFLDNDSYGAPTGSLQLASLEGIPAHVYARTHDFYAEGPAGGPGDDEADVMAALLSDVIAPSFGFELDVTQTGQAGDHSYDETEDRTVADALNELATASLGPEWTIRLSWEDGRHQRFVKTIFIGPRTGATALGTVFENGHAASRNRARSGVATYVRAVSDGSGDGRPMSDAYVDQVALDAGVPQWELRVSYTAVDDVDQLNRLAATMFARHQYGVTVWSMALLPSRKGCPKVGTDFDAGDTVTIDSDPLPDDPFEWHGTARVIGWQATLTGDQVTTVTPVFWAPTDGVN